MKFCRNEDANILVITALCMTAIMGFMALAIDVGILFRTERQIQTAADAAATAAALDYYYNGTTHVEATAKLAASGNGFTDGTNGVAITVNCPSNCDGAITSTAHTGAGYVEVIISQPTPTLFLRTFQSLFGSSVSPVTVAARAEAGAPGASDYCVYVLV